MPPPLHRVKFTAFYVNKDESKIVDMSLVPDTGNAQAVVWTVRDMPASQSEMSPALPRFSNHKQETSWWSHDSQSG